MKNTVKTFLEKYNTNPENTIIVGFSGGQDSLCLLHILNQLKSIFGYNLVAAHLNHNWRGEESIKEQLFCKDFCKSNNISFETKTLSTDIPHTEEMARKERYQFFNDIATKHNHSLIFTAHSKTDNIETILYRIIKGTGVFGLCGIPENKQDIYPVLRPLLAFSREEIALYCEKNNLKPCQDSSNQNTKYARNKLRLEIIPLMKEINPQIEDSLQNLSQIAQNYEENLQNFVKNEEFSPINFQKMNSFFRKMKIHNFLIKNNIDYDFEKIQNIETFILENCKKPCGKKMSISAKKYLFCSKNELKLIKNEPSFQEKKVYTIKQTGETILNDLGVVFSISQTTAPTSFPTSCEKIAFVNLKEENLYLRTRQKGDKICPFGHSTPIKLKDYFIKKGIPKHQRDDILLLTNEEEVLWAIGVGLSEKLRAKKAPIFKLEMRKNNET